MLMKDKIFYIWQKNALKSLDFNVKGIRHKSYIAIAVNFIKP